MQLQRYKAKRNLKISKEPKAKLFKRKGGALQFVIQKHQARNLHYDFRLEVNGVLKSWAIPKGPSLDPAVKRLAIMVEDHPYSYKDFEGIIAEGYGKGSVLIWDRGTYTVGENDAKDSEKIIAAGIKKGEIKITLYGEKLHGDFALVRINEEKNQWLFMKKKDSFASSEDIQKNEASVVSKKTLLEVGGGANFLTNLDKIFWKNEKITKKDLLQYYSKIAPTIIPYLKDRPESLKRYPNGIAGESFFQKNLEKHPEWVKTVAVKHENKTVNYLLIQDEMHLLYAVNMGCIEMHPWFSRFKTPHKPDFLVFDLDPENISFNKVIETALELHDFLMSIDVPSFCKTSGATGMHICVPLAAKYTYEQVVKFAELVAHIVHQRIPSFTSVERSKKKRDKKVYIDFLQNNYGQTIASVYSVRAFSGAPVSTPLEWKEVKKGIDPKDYNIFNTVERVKKKGDLFKPVLGKGIDLKKCLKKVEKFMG